MMCWSQNCYLVWNTPRQGSKHNPTLKFQHLNLIWINTQHHITSVCLFEASDHYFALWANWWKGLVFPWVGLRSKHHSSPCNPMDYREWKVETVDYQSTVCLCPFFFTVSLKYPISLWRYFQKYFSLRIQLLQAKKYMPTKV